MNSITRFIPIHEIQKYEAIFNTSTFTKLLNSLKPNLPGVPKQTSIVEIITPVTQAEKEQGAYAVKETNKLMDYGNDVKMILTHYEAKSDQKTDTGEVLQIWMKENGKKVFKEYVNGILSSESNVEEIYDIYKDFVNISPLTGKQLDSAVQPMYNPLSCIQDGSCCYFEGQRYEHCGKYCGIYENAGGGTAINSFDTCCKTHDIQIHGKKGKDRCPAHVNFMSCTKNLSTPGAKTIRGGIRAEALRNGCGVV